MNPALGHGRQSRLHLGCGEALAGGQAMPAGAATWLAGPAPPGAREVTMAEIRNHEPMARHTTWRVGGPADRYLRPADADDLALQLAALPATEPLFWLGLGSNLLVRDGGIRGTVIATHKALGPLARLEGDRMVVGAGVACAKVARQALREGLLGAEFLVGIPGTFGGALAMNAGAFGGETWALVEEVQTIDRQGQRRWRSPADFEIGYRHVLPRAATREEWFVAAALRLEAGAVASARARMKAWLQQRAATQPLSRPSCGSVFRNPPGDHAARLIEAAGLKGRRCGGAQVSLRHANFIINTGTATAADIESLIRHVQAEVERAHGLRLETEVRIVGQPA